MAPSAMSPPTSTESRTLSSSSSALDKPFDSFQLLEQDPGAVVRPTRALYNTFLETAKAAFDPVALSISVSHAQRLQESRRKRKRGNEAVELTPDEVLRVKKVHTEGFGFDQVWAQAQKVVDAATKEMEDLLLEVQSAESTPKAIRSAASKDVVEPDVDGSDESFRDGDESSPEDQFKDEEDDDEVADDDDVEDEVEEDLMSGLENGDLDEDSSPEEESLVDNFVQDPNGLNDGFFSIDNFNKQSEFLERQDARGDPDDGAASNEEEVDWAADPMASSSVRVNSGGIPAQKGRPGKRNVPKDDFHDDLDDEDEDGDDDDDEAGDGPTFGDFDLDAPEGASDMEDGDMDGAEFGEDDESGNANNIMYADFFEPPARKAASKKRGRPHPHNFPQSSSKAGTNHASAEDDDIERTMRIVQNDLFPSDEEESGDDEEEEALDPGDPKSRRSTHERRQAALAEEIRKLEAENVAKRKWTLAGEARAADRPLNSLLEEDLDFERAGKPVQPATQEANDDIEAMIKRRILARDFDEVIRRRPDEALGAPAGVRRGKLDFELSEQKSGKGLAEEYEEEHMRRTDPNFVDARDERLRREHREVEALWRDVSAKLDALSSWHYRPRPAAPQLEVRVDAPALAMEDARPTAGAGGVATASALAPQEVYAPGEGAGKRGGGGGELVAKSGLPVARDEMTREQKKRRRMREKERAKKAGGNAQHPAQAQGKRAKEKNGIIGDLKRAGVKVIGKKGELRDVDGNAASNGGRASTGGAFKL